MKHGQSASGGVSAAGFPKGRDGSGRTAGPEGRREEDMPDGPGPILGHWWRTARGGSDAHRLMARYLERNYRQAAFMTSAELAAAVGVSQASVTRFAVALGFSGYGEWVKEMQRVIRMELSAADRMWLALNPGDGSGDRTLAGEELALGQLESIAEGPRFSDLAQGLSDAGRVVVAGARASATLVPYLSYFLGKVRPGVVSATPGSPLWDQLALDEPSGTLVVALAFPRYPRQLIEWLDGLSGLGFRIAAVTDRLESPAVSNAELALAVPVTAASLFDSYAAPVTALNLLVRRVAQLSPERSRERLSAIEEWDLRRREYV